MQCRLRLICSHRRRRHHSLSLAAEAFGFKPGFETAGSFVGGQVKSGATLGVVFARSESGLNVGVSLIARGERQGLGSAMLAAISGARNVARTEGLSSVTVTTISPSQKLLKSLLTQGFQKVIKEGKHTGNYYKVLASTLRRAMGSKKCTDTKKEGQIGLAIVLAGARGEEPVLSPDLQKHLEECESCRDRLYVWKEKAKSTRKASDSYDIVNRAAAGDPTILRKRGISRTAYFKPHQDGEWGMLVVVTSENVILDPEEITLEEFKRLTDSMKSPNHEL